MPSKASNGGPAASLRDFFLKGPGIEPSIDPRGTSPSLQAPSHVAKTLSQLEVNLNST